MLVGIGQKIKQVRNSKGLTLKELSAMTDLSTGYLSQLERGLNTIAVDSLLKIANALGLTLHSFIDELEGEERDEIVMRSYEKEPFFAERSHYLQYHLSVNKASKSFLPRLVEILPTRSNDELIPYGHEGEEFVYVLEGILTLHFNHKKYDLYPGDSAHYDSRVEHTWANYTNKLVRYLSINSPNPFRVEEEDSE